jgi:hypothetical protein
MELELRRRRRETGGSQRLRLAMIAKDRADACGRSPEGSAEWPSTHAARPYPPSCVVPAVIAVAPAPNPVAQSTDTEEK